jgi:hypothetical protein
VIVSIPRCKDDASEMLTILMCPRTRIVGFSQRGVLPFVVISAHATRVHIVLDAICPTSVTAMF